MRFHYVFTSFAYHVKILFLFLWFQSLRIIFLLLLLIIRVTFYFILFNTQISFFRANVSFIYHVVVINILIRIFDFSNILFISFNLNDIHFFFISSIFLRRILFLNLFHSFIFTSIFFILFIIQLLVFNITIIIDFLSFLN